MSSPDTPHSHLSEDIEQELAFLRRLSQTEKMEEAFGEIAEIILHQIRRILIEKILQHEIEVEYFRRSASKK